MTTVECISSPRSGLFAPYWRADARGSAGRHDLVTQRDIIARAALEATAFQTCEVPDAVNADSWSGPTELKVDGGMIANNLLRNSRPTSLRSLPYARRRGNHSLCAAYAAGLATGFLNDLGELRSNWQEDSRWTPNMDEDEPRPPNPPSGKAVTKPSTGPTTT
jgi:glycerol kinase